MRLDPKPAPTTERCKIKPVYPAFRSVSTPRRTKDLPVRGPVNPETALGTTEGSTSASKWSPENPSERLRSELTPSARNRLVPGDVCPGTSAEQLLWSTLSEVA